MQPIPLTQFARLVHGDARNLPTGDVSDVTIDSRRIAGRAVFFALAGTHTDGHHHVRDAIRDGAVAAVVARRQLPNLGSSEGLPLIVVDEPLRALQQLATWWRTQLHGRVIAITGSNGKTVTKDALLTCLAGSSTAAGSIGSYNSQLGVALALLRLPQTVDVAVMEAGISAPGEMAALRGMLVPDHGILTNIGLAHIAAFTDRAAIAAEKLLLFSELSASSWLLVPPDEPLLESFRSMLKCELIAVGRPGDRVPWIEDIDGAYKRRRYTLRFPNGTTHTVRTTTPAVELLRDLELSAAAAYLLGVSPDAIALALDTHAPASTRMEIWRSSTTGITIINDSCSADPVSVRAALRSLANLSEAAPRRIFVFGGMRQLGDLEVSEHRAIGRMAAQHGVTALVLFGASDLDAAADGFLSENASGRVVRCARPEQMRDAVKDMLGDGDVILFKGPRDARIDVVARQLLETIAPNRLVVDLQAVAENIRVFRRHIGAGKRILAMVKALAYGSDLVRLGVELQTLGVDFLGVSSPDEGAQLRRAGIDLPILVNLCTNNEADKMARYDLTAALYSPDLVAPLAAAARARGQRLAVHLKVDTGMGRLGVLPDQLSALANLAAESDWLDITGVMTHFGCADDPAEDAVTTRQIELFDDTLARLHAEGHIGLIRHAANTAGAARFANSHYDMVRVGLGLFGVYPSDAVHAVLDLHLAVALRSRIGEVRALPRGARIGYGGTYLVQRESMRIGIVPIGYHDGVPWSLGGRGFVLVEGQRAAIVGRISMDSLTIDLTDIPSAERGSEVTLYGEGSRGTLRPEEQAEMAGTIVYELLARIQGRVQRIFLGS